MKTREFFFDLPEELIAQRPPQTRGDSRLMLLDRGNGAVGHHRMRELPEILKKGSLLVFNDTRVRRARLYGTPLSPGPASAVEFLLLEQHPGDAGPSTWRCMVNRSKRQRVGRSYEFPGGVKGIISSADGQYRTVEFTPPVDDIYLDTYGHVPLPPYIRREDEPADADRYQTVYARETGSAAAPTAGLHFTQELLDSLASAGFESCFVTLHVGLGTFLPVRTEEVADHRMHTEQLHISEETAAVVDRARREKRPIVGVGTTSVRTLESAWNGSRLLPGSNATDIFIYPGYEFGIVDAIFTNFHTPESTLLMLVCAFAGKEHTLSAYREAVDNRYRFFSYGDAMLIQ
ncbi:MAG TPA: tRNA preQ1(34) S-adenosylmethionine ribosyltransferase-isomerase QueA [Spirochaetia bacterium]|nr:tRNA preQ1(34) S-adenosylmethionine ribosyltransferase-isomerase QueA [Spirochaetia bacterium]